MWLGSFVLAKPADYVLTIAIRCGIYISQYEEYIMPKTTSRGSEQTRSQSVSLRVPPSTKHVLQQAAAIAGQTLTDFMVATSAEKARELIAQHRILTMSQASYDEFVAALSDPEIRPAPPLAERLIREYAASAREDGRLDW
jgi:uncharacterized protein (DUF1778 family)